MKANEITVGVSVQMNIDESTAQACLKLVQMYVNQTGRHVIVHRQENGEEVFNFEGNEKDERELLKIENNSLMQEKEALQNTAEKLENELATVERERDELKAKATPARPEIAFDLSGEEFHCPHCGGFVGYVGSMAGFWKFCQDCGQAIDWSEYNENSEQ